MNRKPNRGSLTVISALNGSTRGRALEGNHFRDSWEMVELVQVKGRNDSRAKRQFYVRIC